MSDPKQEIAQRVQACLEAHYFPVLEKQIEEEVKKMEKITSTIEAFETSNKTQSTDNQRVANFKSELHELIDHSWEAPEILAFSSHYQDLTDSLEKLFETIEPIKPEEQSEARFYASSDDTVGLRVLKNVKWSLFHLSRVHVHLGNLFRKDKLRVKYWSHQIPLRNLAKRHYQSGLIADLQDITGLFFKNFCLQYLGLKNWEEATLSSTDNLTDSETKNERYLPGEDIIEILRSAMSEMVEKRRLAFSKEYEVAGTLEFNGTALRDETIVSSRQAAEKKWSRNNKHWKNTLFALFEEWRSDLDIYSLRHSTLSELSEFQNSQFKRLGEHITPEIVEIRKFIAEASQALSDSGDNLQKELKRINYQASKKLDRELVPLLCDKLSGKHVTNLVNMLEVTISQSVEQLSDEHVIVQTNNYDQPMEDDELSSISPYELIAFEKLPVLQAKLGEARKELFSSLESATATATDIDHIVTFSLTSAISTLESTSKTEEALSIALEGLKRATNRLTETQDQLEASLVKNSEVIDQSVNQFCADIMELTVNENVRELRLRIAKAKAAKEAAEVKQKLKQKITERKRLSIVRILKGYQQVRAFVVHLKERFVLTASKPTLSKEVSDFLIESQQAIDKLPLIYRRLYQIEPLEDLELFEGRKEEFRQLAEAFDNWDKGRFGATAILGEKWGGLTTFISYAVRESGFKYSINRHVVGQNVEDTPGFLIELTTALNIDKIESLEQLAEFLNGNNKRIIIIEDIQNLFLRKVNGFEAVKTFMELISLTARNIFWVVSTTEYTWSYLNKAVNIQEFFSYQVRMGEFSDDQVINVILKRNKISGFNVRFEPDPKLATDKKFMQLAEEEQQQQLKKKFFSELNTYAKSNVSMALLFWLLSTKEIDDSTITISSFKRPDLDFLKVLSMDKLYALHALVLHDGLTSEQLSMVLNSGESSSKLNLLALEEDGVLTQHLC